MSLLPPPLALVLGAGGLVPFVALSAPGQRYLPVDAALAPLRRAIGRPSLNGTEVQVVYGAAILSFLGAPHWGLALRRRAAPSARAFRLLWGVTPALLAWPIGLCPARLSLDALSAALALAYVVDGAAWCARLVPRCYPALRTPLTVCAIASLQSHRRGVARGGDALTD